MPMDRFRLAKVRETASVTASVTPVAIAPAGPATPLRTYYQDGTLTVVPRIPKATLFYERKRTLEGTVRKNKRARIFNVCKFCNQPKLEEFGHKAYKSYKYCPSMGCTFEALKTI